jgi:hypothetical protein
LRDESTRFVAPNGSIVNPFFLKKNGSCILAG